MEPVNLSECTIYLIDAAKIFLFWILSKLEIFHIEVNQSKQFDKGRILLSK